MAERKRTTRNHKSKQDRQHNGQKKKDKMKNNYNMYLQNMTVSHKTLSIGNIYKFIGS